MLSFKLTSNLKILSARSLLYMLYMYKEWDHVSNCMEMKAIGEWVLRHHSIMLFFFS